MRSVEREVDRILTRLRNAIDERGFTQLEVQEALGWGRSYIGQLLAKQKSLRIEQVLMILNVLDVDPGEFWGEIFAPARRGRRQPDDASSVRREMRHLQQLIHGLVDLLKESGLINATDLSRAIKRANDGDSH